MLTLALAGLGRASNRAGRPPFTDSVEAPLQPRRRRPERDVWLVRVMTATTVATTVALYEPKDLHA